MTVTTTTTASMPPPQAAAVPKISAADAAAIQVTKQHIIKLASHQKRLQDMRNGLERTLMGHPNPKLVGSVKVTGYPPTKLDQTTVAPVNPYSSASSAPKKGT